MRLFPDEIRLFQAVGSISDQVLEDLRNLERTQPRIPLEQVRSNLNDWAVDLANELGVSFVDAHMLLLENAVDFQAAYADGFRRKILGTL